ncbi:RNA polymerase subunit sigma [Paramagnetospirillum kuznetsovii]|uniref:RNA polymerase subunit sigma n=1 Tax=Paramagnetospirillum kuznetsovii TaxID=2053833 RepID=A0A364P0E3_9PROT|nr:RNA polymerase sigma factor [Paramagnetospirillum kuznetsovii]RAU22773.1 RNA polymerase subunit sigma [Paramagnetospirillum kuznetsovii]
MPGSSKEWPRSTFRDGSPPGDALGDNGLLRAIAEGDRTAFRRLMERHARPMLALATRITGNPDDADEVVQDSFLKVWTLAAKWNSDGPAAFGTWLYRVVTNACLDRRRRVAFAPLEEAGDPPDPGMSGADVAMARQRDSMICAALDAMPPRQSQALALYYFSDLTAPEAAQALELSIPALEALLVRGRRSLRTILERQGITALGDLT